MKKNDILLVLMLFIIAPTTAELGTGAVSAEEFFNPFVFLIFSGLYGTGALTMRELMLRWKKGLASLLLLGAAFGLIEEGLMAKTLFNPNMPEFGILTEFGRWLGVNWIVAEMVIIGHAVFSITIPILLVELIFPRGKDERCLGNLGFLFLLILFAGVWPLAGALVSGNIFWATYNPPFLLNFSTLSLIIFLILLAWILPRDFGSSGSASGRAIYFFMFGFFWNLIFWRIFDTLPFIIYSPITVFFAEILWISASCIFLAHYNWSKNLHRLALISGCLGSLFLFS